VKRHVTAWALRLRANVGGSLTSNNIIDVAHGDATAHSLAQQKASYAALSIFCRSAACRGVARRISSCAALVWLIDTVDVKISLHLV